ncbi:hypothetical protein SELMODRAFT_22406, partial [Selaginella moellendorffii]
EDDDREGGKDHDEDDREGGKHRDEDDDEGHSSKHKGRNPFVLEKPVEIVSTEAGKIHVLPGRKDKAGVLGSNNIGLNFITMEPKALLLPQYIDAPCVLYVLKGKMRLGWVEDGLNQQDLEAGDIYVIPGGLVFYILNTDEAQRLRVFGMFDTSESLETGVFQSAFVGGGTNPLTILSGFDSDVLAASFKVSSEEVIEVLSNQDQGPIVYTSQARFQELVSRKSKSSRASWPWSWSWLNYIPSFSSELFDNGGVKSSSPAKPFNLFKKKPDFENDNGRAITVDGRQYAPLRNASVGVFGVSLKPAAILAPHWNPRAAEIALVTKGQGVFQISFPNGTSALNKSVKEGTIVFVPRYFPMSQIASREGALEFVGFSTSAAPNNPQFLCGASSVLKALDEETLSTAFAAPPEKLRDFLGWQKDAVILAG